MGLDDELRKRAEDQHGLVSRVQAKRLGATASALAHRLSGPDWDAPTPRVLRLVGVPQTSEEVLMTAVLDVGPGAVASHASAGALWEIPGFFLRPMHVSRRKGTANRPTALAEVHRPRLLPESHVTSLRGIPVTTLPRTLFGFAGRMHPARAERAVENVLGKSPAVLPVLHALLDELGEHGRDGVTVMRALLEARPIGYVAPASGLERRFMRILAEAGELPLERQVDVGGHDWIGRVDFVDRQARLVVEIDSDRFHSTKLDRERDRQRDQALVAAGWRAVVRISEEQVWHRPAEAIAVVRRARRVAPSVVPGAKCHAPA